jgi:hypothetical protein
MVLEVLVFTLPEITGADGGGGLPLNEEVSIALWLRLRLTVMVLAAGT